MANGDYRSIGGGGGSLVEKEAPVEMRAVSLGPVAIFCGGHDNTITSQAKAETSYYYEFDSRRFPEPDDAKMRDGWRFFSPGVSAVFDTGFAAVQTRDNAYLMRAGGSTSNTETDVVDIVQVRRFPVSSSPDLAPTCSDCSGDRCLAKNLCAFVPGEIDLLIFPFLFVCLKSKCNHLRRSVSFQ